MCRQFLFFRDKCVHLAVYSTPSTSNNSINLPYLDLPLGNKPFRPARSYRCPFPVGIALIDAAADSIPQTSSARQVDDIMYIISPQTELPLLPIVFTFPSILPAPVLFYAFVPMRIT
jgi:hypothetical protein